MADGTKIEWADATVNAINGCSLASPGCTNCYAMRLAGTRLRNHPSRAGLTTPSKTGPVWNGTVLLSESALLQPLRWRAPRVIFWNAHGDTFHEAVPDEWVDRMFAVMALTPQHKHLVLTKRSARMRAYMTRFSEGGHHVDSAIWEMCCPLPGGGWSTSANTTPWSQRARDTVKTMLGSPARPWVLPNVWLGVSVEDQRRADERIPDLLATPAAGRFLSCEPLLGPIDLARLQDGITANACLTWLDGLDGVIVGGESGTGARPMHPDWARALRDQCGDAGVDFHFKQWGNFSPLSAARPVDGDGIGAVAWPDGTVGGGHADRKGGAGLQMYCSTKAIAGRDLDGITHDDLPWRRAS